MQQYTIKFSRAIWLTPIDDAGKPTGDYEAKEGEAFRVIKEEHSDASSPGVTFTMIAMAGGGSIWAERRFIAPTTALRSSSY